MTSNRIIPDAPTLELITRPDATREEFLAARRQGLGSSDVAAIIGADPYRTSLTVFLEKAYDEQHGSDDDEAEAASDARYWGTVLEAPVAAHFAKRNAVRLELAGTWARNGWQLASPDRLIFADEPGLPDLNVYDATPGVVGSAVGGYEGKTASAWLSPEWDAGNVPDRYLIQTYWQMHVLGLPYVWIAALIGGQRYVQVKIERDQPFIDDLVQLAAAFWWEHVQTGNPPSLVGEPISAALDLVKSLNPVSIEGSILDVDDEFVGALERWQWHKAAARAHSDAADAYEVAIREALGDREIARHQGKQVLKATNIGEKFISFTRKPSRRLYPAAAVKQPTPELAVDVPQLAAHTTPAALTAVAITKEISSGTSE